MLRDQHVLAVIPARGGSKGLQGKNLAKVGPYSLVEWAIKAARAVDSIDTTVLSTDDDEIAEEAARAGLSCDWRRPEELATDEASNIDVWSHAWLASEATTDRVFEMSVLLQPTSPLRRPDDILRCLEVVAAGASSAITVTSTPGHFTPEKTIVLDADARLDRYLGDGFEAIRQKIPTYFHLNGIVYVASRHQLMSHGDVYGVDTQGVIIDRPTSNIDDAYDLELAEWLYEKGYGWSG